MFSFLKQPSSHLWAFLCSYSFLCISPFLLLPIFHCTFQMPLLIFQSFVLTHFWTSITFCSFFLVDDGYLNLFNSDMFVSLPPWDGKLSEAGTMFGLPSYPSHIVDQWSVVLELTLASAVPITSDLLHIPEWWCWLLRGLQVPRFGWQPMLLTCHEPWEQQRRFL